MLIKKHTSQADESFSYLIGSTDAIIYYRDKTIGTIAFPIAASDKNWKREIVESIISVLSEACRERAEPLTASELLNGSDLENTWDDMSCEFDAADYL